MQVRDGLTNCFIPWSVVYKGLGVAGFVEMLVFIGILGFGLWYIWKRGALEWE